MFLTGLAPNIMQYMQYRVYTSLYHEYSDASRAMIMIISTPVIMCQLMKTYDTAYYVIISMKS